VEPIAVVLAYLAAGYICLGTPMIFAPEAAVAIERRLLYPTSGRVRTLGVLLLLVYATPLIIAARHAQVQPGDLAQWLEGFGWLAAASGLWLVATPGPWKRFMEGFWDAASDPPMLRVIGAFRVGFGLILGQLTVFLA
jgi:uncharacterized protein YjeT (DUF2065 family)